MAMLNNQMVNPHEMKCPKNWDSQLLNWVRQD